MNKINFLFLFLSICVTNAQSSKISTIEYNLKGKVKKVMETSEKQGDLITEKEKNDTNTFYNESFNPIVGTLLFNEDGYIIEKRGFNDINKKTLYNYNDSKKLVLETTYMSEIKNNENTPIVSISYVHKTDTIVFTKTILNDNTIQPIVVNQIFKNNLLSKEYTEQKIILYHYDKKGQLNKKEGWRKKKVKEKKIENFQIKYENNIMISNFCPEQNIMKTYYSNGLLKSYKSENRFQEFFYTYDKAGNWITNTVTLDGKPSIKYYRIVEYY